MATKKCEMSNAETVEITVNIRLQVNTQCSISHLLSCRNHLRNAIIDVIIPQMTSKPTYVCFTSRRTMQWLLHSSTQTHQYSIITTLCFKETFPPLNSVTLSNLNRFSNFCTAGKRMKLATKPIPRYPTHLRHVATLPWEIKNSNFLQIFSTYGRKCKQIAF